MVRKVFNLQNVKIALEADDLDICEGESVQIQPSAWVLVSHLLGRVTVKAVKGTCCTSLMLLIPSSCKFCSESNPLQPEENLFEEDEEIRVGVSILIPFVIREGRGALLILDCYHSPLIQSLMM